MPYVETPPFAGTVSERIQAAYEAGRADGMDSERKKTVSYLSAALKRWAYHIDDEALRDFIGDIEDGQHRK